MSFQRPQPGSLFELEFPQSVGIFNSYADAQKAVDYLADEKFAVQNLAIVGTDLKSVERVLGRRSWGTVLSPRASVGYLDRPAGRPRDVDLHPAGQRAGAAAQLPGARYRIGIAFAAAGYAMTRGKRDFTSVTQTVATKYEVLCEHKVAAQAREMLLGTPAPAPPPSSSTGAPPGRRRSKSPGPSRPARLGSQELAHGGEFDRTSPGHRRREVATGGGPSPGEPPGRAASLRPP